MARLKDRVVLVTGGSRGIGLATAALALREGARVAIVARRPETLEAAHQQLSPLGPVFSQPYHVGQAHQAEGLLDAIESTLGPVDGLVNNAGTNPYFGPLLGLSWEAWDKTFEVNLKGPFALTQAWARRLLDRGSPGSVVFVSSILGLRAAPAQGIYGMTKAALLSLTQTLALELGPAGIRANAVAPGIADTRLAAALTSNDTLRRQITARTALGRIARPEEVAPTIVHLIAAESSYVTGQVFVVDGGFTSN
jgi:NAD(P)-dependent dehydrogenase (short-subunit alcohol dehydrogenase family)